MDPLTGALVAVVVGWGSILLVTRLPLDRLVHRRHLTTGGGAALALFGGGLLGLPVPTWLPIATLLAVPLFGRLAYGPP